MKNTRICPKCSSSDIVRVDGYSGPYGSGNNMMIGNTIFSAVNVNRYICCECGYTEEWIDREDIDKKAENGWRYVGCIPTKQLGTGYVQEIDLIFEKEV